MSNLRNGAGVDVDTLKRHVQRNLIVAQLKEVLKFLKLPCSGVKDQLIQRLNNYIDELSSCGDQSNLRSLYTTIMSPGIALPPRNASQPVSLSTAQSSNQRSGGFQCPINYKQSPFWEVVEKLHQPMLLPAMQSNRYSVIATFELSDEQCTLLRGSSIECYILSCMVDSASREQQILYPQSVEVRVNDRQIASNLRGLKNRPGTAKPPEIAGYLDLRPGISNNVCFTYALTQKPFSFLTCIVRTSSVDQLVKRLVLGANRITRSTVIDSMFKNLDPDIEATSSVLTLKCPLSQIRMEQPCRSRHCTHIQCFDAKSFLQLQQQAPTWTCPICSRQLEFRDLVIDEYVETVIQQTSNDVESVKIDPCGRWSVEGKEEITSPGVGDNSDNDLEIIETKSLNAKQGAVSVNHPPSSKYLPAQISPRPSAGRIPPDTATLAGVGDNSNGMKRPASMVIDLTESDDELGHAPKKHHATVTRPSIAIRQSPCVSRNQRNGSVLALDAQPHGVYGR